MKVVYFSYPFFADCDFPLIKALQENGVDVSFYMPLSRNFVRSSIIELDKPAKFSRLTKASKIAAFKKYSDCLDLDKLYLIYGYPTRKFWPLSWLAWIWTVLDIIIKRPDLIHIDWQLSSSFERLLYLLPKNIKRIATVHDPIAHSGTYSRKNEKSRIIFFKWADEMILLNTQQTEDFCKTYNIPKDKINFSHLGIYDSISKVKLNGNYQTPQGPYVLFFGQICKYKGLEYLLDAMKTIHDVHNELRLIVAGGGSLYFDDEPYRNLSYIEWRHHYIDIGELITLLKGCEFVICPYVDATQSGVIQTAYSLNVPVIATSVGGLAESVVDGETGILVPPRDSKALSEAIIKLSNNKDLLIKMRNNIGDKWTTKMSWNPIAEQYINIYKKVLSNGE